MTAKPRKTPATGFIEICDTVTLPSLTFSESATLLREPKEISRRKYFQASCTSISMPTYGTHTSTTVNATLIGSNSPVDRW